MINDNMVKEIVDVETEDEAYSRLSYFQQAIPIDGLDPEPVVGWAWDGVKMYNKLPDITPRQIRTALVLSGVSLTMIDEALGSLPEPTRSFALISWEYAVSYSRQDPLVENVGVMLGWGSTELDNLWIMAGQI